MSKYQVTRAEIIGAAEQMLGLPFLHQGRSLDTGVDCVGLLVVMGQLIKYPEIIDAEAYRRVPSANVIRQTLEANLDEIPLAEAGIGDIYLMRMGGIKPRHAAIIYSTDYDPVSGREPSLIHAARSGVTIEPMRIYPSSWYVAAFRVRGVID